MTEHVACNINVEKPKKRRSNSEEQSVKYKKHKKTKS